MSLPVFSQKWLACRQKPEATSFRVSREAQKLGVLFGVHGDPNDVSWLSTGPVVAWDLVWVKGSRMSLQEYMDFGGDAEFES